MLSLINNGIGLLARLIRARSHDSETWYSVAVWLIVRMSFPGSAVRTVSISALKVAMDSATSAIPTKYFPAGEFGAWPARAQALRMAGEICIL